MAKRLYPTQAEIDEVKRFEATRRLPMDVEAQSERFGYCECGAEIVIGGVTVHEPDCPTRRQAKAQSDKDIIDHFAEHDGVTREQELHMLSDKVKEIVKEWAPEAMALKQKYASDLFIPEIDAPDPDEDDWE